MSSVEIQAVRAFNKFISISTESWGEGEYMDAEVDGGEWSGPVWGDAWAKEIERVTKIVAERFELEDHVLVDVYNYYMNNEVHQMLKAIEV